MLVVDECAGACRSEDADPASITKDSSRFLEPAKDRLHIQLLRSLASVNSCLARSE